MSRSTVPLKAKRLCNKDLSQLTESLQLKKNQKNAASYLQILLRGFCHYDAEAARIKSVNWPQTLVLNFSLEGQFGTAADPGHRNCVVRG